MFPFFLLTEEVDTLARLSDFLIITCIYIYIYTQVVSNFVE